MTLSERTVEEKTRLRATRQGLPLAVVMGGAGGLGLACVRRLAQTHRVLLADLDESRAQTFAGQLQEDGHQVIAAGCDVVDEGSVEQLFARAAELGPVRTLVHVVGLSPVAGDWRKILYVNLAGAVRTAAAALGRMQPGGAAVFISSLAAHSIVADAPMQAVLAAPLAAGFVDAAAAAHGGDLTPPEAYRYSKLGLNLMCRRLAADWGARGARIVSLSPGLIRTPMGDREFDNTPTKYDLLARTPLGRQCEIGEVLDALEFLVSDRASFLTGTDLLLDGGLVAAMQSGGE